MLETLSTGEVLRLLNKAYAKFGEKEVKYFIAELKKRGYKVQLDEYVNEYIICA